MNQDLDNKMKTYIENSNIPTYAKELLLLGWQSIFDDEGGDIYIGYFKNYTNLKPDTLSSYIKDFPDWAEIKNRTGDTIFDSLELQIDYNKKYYNDDSSIKYTAFLNKLKLLKFTQENK